MPISPLPPVNYLGFIQQTAPNPNAFAQATATTLGNIQSMNQIQQTQGQNQAAQAYMSAFNPDTGQFDQTAQNTALQNVANRNRFAAPFAQAAATTGQAYAGTQKAQDATDYANIQGLRNIGVNNWRAANRALLASGAISPEDYEAQAQLAGWQFARDNAKLLGASQTAVDNQLGAAPAPKVVTASGGLLAPAQVQEASPNSEAALSSAVPQNGLPAAPVATQGGLMPVGFDTTHPGANGGPTTVAGVTVTPPSAPTAQVTPINPQRALSPQQIAYANEAQGFVPGPHAALVGTNFSPVMLNNGAENQYGLQNQTTGVPLMPTGPNGQMVNTPDFPTTLMPYDQRNAEVNTTGPNAVPQTVQYQKDATGRIIPSTSQVVATGTRTGVMPGPNNTVVPAIVGAAGSVAVGANAQQSANFPIPAADLAQNREIQAQVSQMNIPQTRALVNDARILAQEFAKGQTPTGAAWTSTLADIQTKSGGKINIAPNLPPTLANLNAVLSQVNQTFADQLGVRNTNAGQEAFAAVHPGSQLSPQANLKILNEYDARLDYNQARGAYYGNRQQAPKAQNDTSWNGFDPSIFDYAATVRNYGANSPDAKAIQAAMTRKGTWNKAATAYNNLKAAGYIQ